MLQATLLPGVRPRRPGVNVALQRVGHYVSWYLLPISDGKLFKRALTNFSYFYFIFDLDDMISSKHFNNWTIHFRFFLSFFYNNISPFITFDTFLTAIFSLFSV